MPEMRYKISSGKVDQQSKLRAIAAFSVLLIVIALAGYIYCLRVIQRGPCLSPQCIAASANLHSSMDSNIKPCEDFYGHVCANMPFQESRIQSSHIIRNLMKHVLEKKPTENEGKALQLQKEFYSSCKDVESMDEWGNDIILQMIDKYGGWPVTQGSKWKHFDIDEAFQISWTWGLPVEFPLRINTRRDGQDLMIQAPKLTNIKSNFQENVYFDLMVDTAMHFGASSLNARKDLSYVLEFEKNILKLMEEKTSEYKIVSKQELEEILTQVNISNIFDLTLPFDATLAPFEADTMFWKEFNLLLAGTSSRTMANFYVWKIIQNFGCYLSSPMRENFFKFKNLVAIRDDPVVSLTDQCMYEARKMFPLVLENTIADTQARGRVEEVEDMVRRVNEAYKSRIYNSEWINEETKAKLTYKLDNIRPIIGSFDEEVILSNSNLEKFSFTSSNTIDMIMDVNIFKRLRIMASNVTFYALNMYEDDDTEISILEDVKYLPEKNSIFIPVYAVYDTFHGKPDFHYLKYGSLGVSIAQQIAYSLYLDSVSSEESVNRTVNETTEMIWTEEMWDHLYSKIICLHKIFSNKTNMQPSVEMFSYTLGIDVAYEAYLGWVSDKGEELKLPGFPYTSQQLFWINFMNQHCMIEDVMEYYPLHQKIEVLKNSLYFSMLFECSPGTKMNCIDKCYIF